MTTKVTNVYNLKLTPSQFGQNSIVVNCSQYDSLFRVIQFNLFNGNSIYSIPEWSVVTIRGTKKDNTGFEYECEYSNNVVTFPLQQQITIFPGKVPAELRITKEGEIIGSWNFLFLVEESPLSDETTISETQLPLLEQAIEAAGRLNEAFDDITEFTDETYPNAVQTIQNEGATQVSNVTNEGTTQRGLVSSEGATQIANIQAEGTTQKGLVTSEGTTQVGNVQTKGTEVLDSIPSDYTELSNDVDTLNNAFYTVHGLNRNPNNDVNGYLKSDGTLAQYGDWKTTDYCYVGDLENICASCNGVGYTQRLSIALYFLCLYDENKTFIRQVDIGGAYTWTVEEGTSYVRFSYHSDIVENIMLESGTRWSPAFVEYEEPKRMLKKSYYNSGADWSDKLWVCVGDSLTEVNIRTNKHYHDYIADATGIQVSNMGYSGSGYKRSEGDNNAFYQRILNVPTNANVVTIFGSGNDMNYTAMGFSTFDEALGSPTDTGTTTICGCINTTIDNLYSVLPTVQLGIVTPTPWASYSPSSVNNDMDKYSNAIVSICQRRGIPCLDLYHESGMRPWEASYRELCYSKDEVNGTHPNELGHEIMAPHFKAFLEKIVL